MIHATDTQSLTHQLPRRPIAGVVGLSTADGSPAAETAARLDVPLLQLRGRSMTVVRSGRTQPGDLLFVDRDPRRLTRITLPGIKACVRTATATTRAPLGKAILISPDSPSWFHPARCTLYADQLQQLGLDCAIVPARHNVADHLDDCDMIFNHALSADVPSLQRLAQRQPHTQVVHVNHSSLAFLQQTPVCFRKYVAACGSARRTPNVWSVSQCHVPAVTGCDRVRQMSCPVNVLEQRTFRPPHSPVRLVMAGRCCPTKNQVNCLFAAAELRQTCELHLCVALSPELQQLADLLNLQPINHGILSHSSWLDFLRTEADILLQPSLTESYNVAAAEAMQLGVPTIATACVHAADPSLIVHDPNNAAQIAQAVTKALNDYPRHCRQAHHHGHASATTRNAEYADFVRMIQQPPVCETGA